MLLYVRHIDIENQYVKYRCVCALKPAHKKIIRGTTVTLMTNLYVLLQPTAAIGFLIDTHNHSFSSGNEK